jgi:hypothetical protein
MLASTPEVADQGNQPQLPALFFLHMLPAHVLAGRPKKNYCGGQGFLGFHKARGSMGLAERARALMHELLRIERVARQRKKMRADDDGEVKDGEVLTVPLRLCDGARLLASI